MHSHAGAWERENRELTTVNREPYLYAIIRRPC